MQAERREGPSGKPSALWGWAKREQEWTRDKERERDGQRDMEREGECVSPHWLLRCRPEFVPFVKEKTDGVG